MSAGSDSSLAAYAYQEVRRRIVRGEIGIGQSVSRRKLAAELGMSFLPVSEALLRLEFEGMLESRPRAGTRVRIPSRDDVTGHYLVREVLEAEAARRFAEYATKTERRELRRMAAKVDALSARPDRGPYLALHHRLHSRIAECARSAALTKVIEQTCALSSSWFCLMQASKAGSKSERHRDLARALATLTPDEAAAFMREHVRHSQREAMDRLAPYFVMRKAQRATFVRGRGVHVRRAKRRSHADA